MNKIKAYFNLNRIYEFDVTDITAIIYVICAIGVMCGQNMTIPFCIGALISVAFCWQARRLNLIILNVALFAMNIYNLIIMLIGG